jgi:hypothetical protein
MNMPSFAALAAALAATSACSVIESVETKTYDLSGFDSITAKNGVNVALTQGPFSVKAEGPKSKIDRLMIERRGNELIIAREPTIGWGTWSRSDLVTVAAPTYAGIMATGGADVYGENLQLGDIRIDASGGADINLSGACKTLDLKASGGADVRSRDLVCEAATVSASGGADAYITATRDASGRGSGGADIAFYDVSGTATGDASSGADIRFHGNPTNVQIDESSGGDISVSDD